MPSSSTLIHFFIKHQFQFSMIVFRSINTNIFGFSIAIRVVHKNENNKFGQIEFI